MSAAMKEAVDKSLSQWGLKVTSFFVESLSLPDEVQKHLDKASSMRVIGDLDRYAKFQSAEAIEAAASQPGGAAGAGVGMGAGLAMGQAMAAGLSGASAPAGGQSGDDPFATIERLHKLVTIGAISQEEFDSKKAELLGRIR
jgi:membrane protease subunit (stomatin/prohibitin family)